MSKKNRAKKKYKYSYVKNSHVTIKKLTCIIGCEHLILLERNRKRYLCCDREVDENSVTGFKIVEPSHLACPYFTIEII